jgi:hypothetical protein
MFIKRTKANIAAGQTDAALVAAVAGTPIKVIGLALHAGAVATTVTFNTKPSGAGTAISCVFALAANQSVVLPIDREGWFETAVGEGLSVTTGAGATTGIQVVYSQNVA